jgi:folate-dependent phosphoribosylglycinamide formyltransferase PurN
MYAEMEIAVKDATARRDEFRDRMLAAMTDAGIEQVKVEGFTCSLVGESERKGFDYKRMIKEHPDLADMFGEYETTTKVKPSIRIILK